MQAGAQRSFRPPPRRKADSGAGGAPGSGAGIAAIRQLHRQTLASLGTGMLLIAAVIAAVSTSLLYRAAYRQELAQLEGGTLSLASMLEAVAQFDARFSAQDNPGGSFGATMSQVEEGLLNQRFTRPSERLVVGIRRDGNIEVWGLKGNGRSLNKLSTEGRAEGGRLPLALALDGRSGSGEFTLQGRRVLAGFAPVPTLGIGLAHHVDLAAVRAPFIQAGWLCALATLLALAAGAAGIPYRLRPLEREAIRAARALEQSESRFALAAQGANQGIWDWDLRSGQGWLSPRGQEMLGFTPGGMQMGWEAWRERIHPEDRERVDAEVRRHLAEREPFRTEYRLRMQNGTYRWFRATGQAEWDAEGRPLRFAGSTEDIAENIQQQRDLEASRSYLKAIFDNEPECIKLLDRTGRLLDMNPAGLAMVEAESLEQVRGQVVANLVCPADQQAFRELTAAVARGEKGSLRFEIEGLRGRHRHLETHAVPLRDANGEEIAAVLAVTRDVTEVVKAEEELRRERDFATSLLDTAPVIVLLLDTEGRIVHVNSYFEQLCGYSLTEVQGKDWFSTLLPERDADRIRALFRTAVGAQATRGNVNAIVTRSGEERLIEWSDQVMRGPQGELTGLLAIGLDITEREKAASDLKEREEQFRNLSEMASEGLAIHRDGVVELANRAFAEMTGHASPEELVGRSGIEAIPFTPESRRTVIEHIESLTLDTYQVELERKDGSKLLALTSGRPITYQGSPARLVSLLDITGRVQAEEAVQESLKRLNAAQRIAKVGSWDLDLKTSRLIWSDEIFRLFEIDPEKFGASYEAFLDAIHPEDREMVDEAYMRSLESRTPYSIVHRLLMPDGRIKYVREECETHYSEAGRALRSIGTVQDITAEVLAAQKLEAQLNEKELLLKEVHHRVKNNLQIISSLFYLQASTSGDRGLKELLRDSQNRIEAMVHLHETLYQREDFTSIDFRDYADTLCSYLLQSFGADSTRISLEVSGDGTALDLNRAVTCGLIINEAVSNSLKYAFPDGRAGKIAVGYSRRPDGWLELQVSDNGVGLPGDGAAVRDGALGVRLIERLAGQLGGKVERGSGPGVEYRIAFPEAGA